MLIAGIPISTKLATSFTTEPATIDMIGFLSSLYDWSTAVLTASIPTRKMVGARTERRGAAVFADSSLKSSLNIGSESAESPSAQGSAMMEDTLRVLLIIPRAHSLLCEAIVTESRGTTA